MEERFWQIDVSEPYIQAMFGARNSPVYNHIWSPDVNDISLKVCIYVVLSFGFENLKMNGKYMYGTENNNNVKQKVADK